MTTTGTAAGRLDSLLEQNRRLAGRLLEVETAHAELIRLYVTLSRLTDAAPGADALAAVQDLVSAVVGSELFQVYRCDAGTPVTRVGSMGFGPNEPGVESVVAFVRGALAAGGACQLDPRLSDPASPRPIGCIPLGDGATVDGVVVLYGLLAHKYDWEPTDPAVFEILARHGGKALRAVTR